MYRQYVLAAVLIVASCSNSSFTSRSASSGGDTSQDSNQDSNQDSSDTAIPGATTDDYSPLAEPPQMVTGAWMTCGVESTDLADETTYGCGAYESNEKMTGNIDGWEITVKDTQTGEQLIPSLTTAASASPWHVTFTLPVKFDQTTLNFIAAANIKGKRLTDQVGFDTRKIVMAKRVDQQSLAELSASREATSGNIMLKFMIANPEVSKVRELRIRYRSGSTYPAITCDDLSDQVIDSPILVDIVSGFAAAVNIPASTCLSACAIRVCGYTVSGLLWGARDKISVAAAP